MIASRRGRVLEILGRRPGLTELLVEVDGRLEKAVSYDELTGQVEPGDEVQLNTTAVKLGLGSGGYHFVMANLARSRLDETGSGHAMKLRYTPLQLKVLAVEEEASPYSEKLRECRSLAGLPVVAGSLHSVLAPVAAGIKWRSGYRLKVAYVMTDGGALPMALSRQVAILKEAGLLDGTLTVGQSFGGDLEAVNVYSGLLAARSCLEADVVVVAMGPGILGTATAFGFSGIEQGQVLNAAYSLQGCPIAVPRISFQDPRPRHRGLSHHTLTVLEQVCLGPVLVALPLLEAEKTRFVMSQLHGAGLADRYQIVFRDGRPALRELERLGLEVDTMGRGLAADEEFFAAAAAAGVLAAEVAMAEPAAWPARVGPSGPAACFSGALSVLSQGISPATLPE